MEFLITVFLLIAIGYKLSKDKYIGDRVKKKYQDWQDAEDRLKSEAVNDEVERRLERELRDRSNHERFYEELSDDLQYVFGDNWREMFDLNQAYVNVDYPQYWALQLLLAKQGLVSWKGIAFGYQTGGPRTFQYHQRYCERIGKYISARYPYVKIEYSKPFGYLERDWGGKYYWVNYDRVAYER